MEKKTNIKKIFFIVLILTLLFPSFPIHPPKALASTGNIGMWSDNTGSQVPTTSFGSFTFANQVRNDGIYTFLNNDTLQFDESGNYLLIATIKSTDTSNGRVNREGRFSYSGSGNFVTTYGSSYSRDTNNNTDWLRVVGLVWNASENDTATFQWRRDTDAGIGGSIADASFFQVVKLHDNAAVGMYMDSSDTGTYGTQTWTDAPFNTTVFENDTSVIEKQSGSTDIRLKQDNTTFLVGYGIAFSAPSGNTRTQRVTKMVADSSSIPQSYSYAYIRQASDEYGDPNGLFLYRNAGTSTDLSVQAQLGNADNAGSAARQTNTSGMFVVELPAGAEVFISHDGTGGQDIGGTNGDLNAMTTVDYNDSAAFTKVNNTTVTTEKAMNVLLLGSAYAERSNTNSTRMTAGTRFEIEGIDQSVGEHGNFLRGNQGTTDTYNYATHPTGLFAVESGNDIQFEWFDAGDNGSSDLTVENAVGFSALNLDSLAAATVVSVTITTDGTISYGTLSSGATTSTISLSDTQTAQNDGNVTEDFNIKTSAPSGWSLGASSNTDTFVHEFSTNSGGVWTKFTTEDSYQTLVTNMIADEIQSFDLRFTAPNPATSSTEKTITVTIQAVEH